MKKTENTEPAETRKLSAVMFTDIEGYTSLFGKDESKALSQVEHHRQMLHDVAARYHGKIIQFYGDGSVTTYPSVIEAVHAAIELQQQSRDAGIPLRAGIHLGDLIFKQKDIFGDVVNIASRIQSTGIPGSVIVSAKVADELKNHPDIQVTPIGQYQLKNVEMAMDLYAITGHGLAIPAKHNIRSRKWPLTPLQSLGTLVLLAIMAYFLIPMISSNAAKARLRSERIAIPPFENLTQDPLLDGLSNQIADWITSEIIETEQANVMQFQSGMLLTNGNMSIFRENPLKAYRLGCKHIVKGSYNYTNARKDSLVLYARILDTQTGEVLPLRLEKVYCSTDNPFEGIRRMGSIIKGYWKSREENYFSPPNYEAYKKYLEALSLWGGPKEDESRPLLIKAIELDTQFIDPYFSLLDLFANTHKPQHALDTVRLIRSRFTDLTPRQENFLRFQEEDLIGRRRNAWNYFEKELARDSQDLHLNTTGIVLAMEYLNDPQKALHIYKQMDNDSFDLNLCDYCRTRMISAIKAFMALGDPASAGMLADKVRLYITRPGEYITLLSYYISAGDTATVSTLLERAEMDTSGVSNYKYLTYVAGREAQMKGNAALRDYYADRAIAKYDGASGRPLARCYYLKGDLEKALSIYHQALKEKPDDRQILGELGLVYARLGNVVQATDIIQQLDQIRKPLDYGETSYFQGRIKANLGDPEGALADLSASLDEGQTYRTAVTFQYDPDLLMLRKHPGFQALLTRNRQK